MLRILVCWTWVALAAGAGPTYAQQETLSPQPANARIRLIGAAPINALGPLDLSTLSTGEWTLIADSPGYAAARFCLLRSAPGRTELRAWSGPSALVQPPGFAHLRHAEPRGWLHLGGWAASGMGLLVATDELHDARDRLARAATELAAAETSDQKRAAALRSGAASEAEFDHANIRDLWAAYFAAAWLGAGIEAWLLTPRPEFTTGRDGHIEVILRPADALKAALGSLVVPGAGQRSLGHDQRGNFFSAAILLTAGGAIVAQDAFLDARRERTHAERLVDFAVTTPDRDAADAALRDAVADEGRSSTVRYVVFGTALALHTWNVIDAFTLGRRRADPSDTGLTWVPLADGVSVAWTWRFDSP